MSRYATSGAAAVATVLALGATHAPPQATIRIDGSVVCDDCEVRLERVITLRDDPDLTRPIVGSTTTVSRGPAGRIFLVHNADNARVQVFEPNGDYLDSLGSRGQGPGQFRSAGPLVFDSAGNLYVFDRFQERITVFSPSLEVVETKRVPRLRVREVLRTDAGFVVAAQSFAEDFVGFPLHLLTSDLKLTASFGTTDETARPDMVVLQLRSIARGVEDLVWSAPYNRYVLEAWHPATGTRRRTLERDIDWFQPWYEPRGISDEAPPQPVLRDIWQDGDGLLWVLVTVPADEWRDGLARRGMEDVIIRDWSLLNDTIVEVIDPSTGQLIGSRKFSQFLGGFTNDGLVISNREEKSEGPSVTLWKPTLRR